MEKLVQHQRRTLESSDSRQGIVMRAGPLRPLTRPSRSRRCASHLCKQLVTRAVYKERHTIFEIIIVD